VHASGVLADASIRNQTAAGVRSVTAPKGRSMEALAPQLAPHPVALHMMFSSLAALLPSAGQANYAAANAELESAAAMCGLATCTYNRDYAFMRCIAPGEYVRWAYASAPAGPVMKSTTRSTAASVATDGPVGTLATCCDVMPGCAS